MRNDIIYSLTLYFIEFQLARIANGVKKEDNKTKGNEIPSMPK